MYRMSSTFRDKVEQLAQQVLGIELALLVMVMVFFLIVYMVR